ncbi:MAG: NAD(P)H-dependent glycerol-3-phosphate dehydrogenase [Deferribacteres bacterium]|nr:NAD(P)H-dependent glycerol-3-phosphate dehydrogenase [candidate division KSB1 bacterium]MCB9501225.1 NAD(P)H-dependent glycerol-3-phosphate dehydrogenase [Deferribacteres bacterium]
MAKVSVIGSGGWGTALGTVLDANGHEVVMYAREKELIDAFQNQHENTLFLPGIKLSEKIRITNDIQEAIEGCGLIVVAVPTKWFRSALKEMLPYLKGKNPAIVSVTKGIEIGTLLTPDQIMAEVFADNPYDFICLSGPSHAEEVARGIPTAVTVASDNPLAAKRAQDFFMGPNFRVYTHSDVIGVELGGALKNIIALAAGICDGVGFGDNTKAALMTRGLSEMTRIGVAMGADPLTFAGLSGMGDLIVTCMSRHSRNRYVGDQIGKGRTLKEVLDEMVMVAEGVTTTESAHELAIKLGIEMPITNKVYNVLFKNVSPRKAVADLMEREAKAETLG